MTGCELAVAQGYAAALRRRSARGHPLPLDALRWLQALERLERQATS